MDKKKKKQWEKKNLRCKSFTTDDNNVVLCRVSVFIFIFCKVHKNGEKLNID